MSARLDPSAPPVPLSEVFDSFARVLNKSSRDWGAYWADHA